MTTPSINQLPQAHLPLTDNHAKLMACHKNSLLPVVLITDTQDDTPENLIHVLVNPSEDRLNTVLDGDPDLKAEQTTLHAFTSNLWRFSDPQHAMTDQDWQTLTELASEGFKKSGRPFYRMIPASLESWTPLDMPAHLVAQRLEVIQRTPYPNNLRAQIRLAEIEMANCFNREPNKALFDTQAITPTWEERVREAPLDKLKEHYANREVETQKLKTELEVKRRSGHPIDPIDLDSLVARETLLSEGHEIVNQAARLQQIRQAEQDDMVELIPDLDNCEAGTNLSMH